MTVCVCVCVWGSSRGPTLFLLSHVLGVALAVSVVALLLTGGLDATALHLVHFLRQIACRDRPLRQHLQLLTGRERGRERKWKM